MTAGKLPGEELQAHLTCQRRLSTVSEGADEDHSLSEPSMPGLALGRKRNGELCVAVVSQTL